MSQGCAQPTHEHPHTSSPCHLAHRLPTMGTPAAELACRSCCCPGVSSALHSLLASLWRHLSLLAMLSARLAATLWPDQFCCCLQRLDMGVNQLSGNMDFLVSMPYVTEVLLDGNQLTGAIPNFLSGPLQV